MLADPRARPEGTYSMARPAARVVERGVGCVSYHNQACPCGGMLQSAAAAAPPCPPCPPCPPPLYKGRRPVPPRMGLLPGSTASLVGVLWAAAQAADVMVMKMVLRQLCGALKDPCTLPDQHVPCTTACILQAAFVAYGRDDATLSAACAAFHTLHRGAGSKRWAVKPAHVAFVHGAADAWLLASCIIPAIADHRVAVWPEAVEDAMDRHTHPRDAGALRHLWRALVPVATARRGAPRGWVSSCLPRLLHANAALGGTAQCAACLVHAAVRDVESGHGDAGMSRWTHPVLRGLRARDVHVILGRADAQPHAVARVLTCAPVEAVVPHLGRILGGGLPGVLAQLVLARWDVWGHPDTLQEVEVGLGRALARDPVSVEALAQATAVLPWPSRLAPAHQTRFVQSVADTMHGFLGRPTCPAGVKTSVHVAVSGLVTQLVPDVVQHAGPPPSDPGAIAAWYEVLAVPLAAAGI